MFIKISKKESGAIFSTHLLCLTLHPGQPLVFSFINHLLLPPTIPQRNTYSRFVPCRPAASICILFQLSQTLSLCRDWSTEYFIQPINARVELGPLLLRLRVSVPPPWVARRVGVCWNRAMFSLSDWESVEMGRLTTIATLAFKQCMVNLIWRFLVW